ncbi:insulin-like growth factor-binding protein complex acid labile subunit [Pseudoliparis swirei]|uniref:insulin-like growth factor-binding protein complex acid labile subunit n=1 Tax=Pseudoliparis swirei TaxID=2059687 RepID=UPI0024BE7F90|nr:insulin-like growth factor-binding protein complex acid labile subunit [Pseudoliparis swirei]
MCPRLPALLVSLLALHSPPSLLPTAGCSPPCPPRCACYEHADLVDCRDRALQRVPAGVPRGTWLMELGGNNLSHIAGGAFAGLWSLRVLVLTDSRIRDLQPQAFLSLPVLEQLDLSWNRLAALPDDLSNGLPALRELRLDHNRLQRVSGSSFQHLDHLEKLLSDYPSV